MKQILLSIFLLLSLVEAHAQDVAAQTYICPGDTVDLIAKSDSADFYEWYKDGIYLTSTAYNKLTVSDLGVYSVIAYNLYGCKSDPSKAFLLEKDSLFAEEDTASLHYTESALIPLINNDHRGCYELDPTSIQIVSGPYHGRAVIKGDGTVDYLPTDRTNNIDHFIYTISDVQNNTSNKATVTIWIGSECGVIYPNPTIDKAKIRTRNKEARFVRICDISGRILQVMPVQEGETEISVGVYSDAIYLIQLMNESGKAICTFKLEKRTNR